MERGFQVLEVDRSSAAQSFRAVEVERILLAVLAGVRQPEWEGSQVGEVSGGEAGADRYRVGVIGSPAVAATLARALQAVGVVVSRRDRAPGESVVAVAELSGGSWVEPAPR